MSKIYQALARAEEDNKIKYLDHPLQMRPAHLPQVQVFPEAAEASEWFKELFAKLRTLKPKDELKTILFTSVSEGDGSSSTAAGFASSLAKSFNQNVLLIDANLRKPAMNRIFDETSANFLAELTELPTETALSDQTAGGKLCVITNDAAKCGEMSILGSETFAIFLKTARDKYDYIILDAPPVSAFPETKILSTLADGVVLVVLAGKTRKQVMIKAQTEIKMAQGRLIGVVLNRRKHHIPDWLYKWI